MSLLLRPLLLLLLCIAGATAADANPENAAAFDDDTTNYLKDIEEEAGEFRDERRNLVVDPAVDARAASYITSSQEAYDRGEYKRARKLSHKGWKVGRHTASSAVLGELKRIRVLAEAKLDRVYDLRRELARLWLYFPEYPHTRIAMSEALACGERVQGFSALVNLDAEDPQEVVALAGENYQTEINKLFRFLSEHGDRATVAARADLGLARALLLTGDRNDLTEARIAYADFIARHPDHEMIFAAICELALSHIVAYRGEFYDVGSLVNAALIIDQAELVTGGDVERAQTVARYRARIRGWHQDRDLSVARWYRDRGIPAWMRWLKEPSGYDWNDAARFYFNEVIRRDRASSQARAATRELAELPAQRRDPIRADLLPAGGR